MSTVAPSHLLDRKLFDFAAVRAEAPTIDLVRRKNGPIAVKCLAGSASRWVANE